MKIAASLLQVIGLALVIPAVTASCSDNERPETAQIAARVPEKDSLKRKPAVRDTVRTDTSRRPVSRDYCPPCGKG